MESLHCTSWLLSAVNCSFGAVLVVIFDVNQPPSGKTNPFSLLLSACGWDYGEEDAHFLCVMAMKLLSEWYVAAVWCWLEFDGSHCSRCRGM
ncbi:hypothetical protein B0T20DRAFT_426608 [Sordaria brevicollis]|uniref:Uncharacterized protein n=1 Tax=Sordaria brevicollis TaxID=83679 RepID=A0AAE0NVD8_SORBR|nr:hypothetical protein B0T20DRAFT_426608 [Sordaria brevicollis]